jgi:hypothetical protein
MGPSIELIEKSFDVQDYPFSLPTGSPFRNALNVAVLDRDEASGGIRKQTEKGAP